MENTKNMKRRNTSRTGAKQTSTPLNDNRDVEFLKTLSNLSSIQDEYRRKRHFVIESPLIFDLESSRTTGSSKYSSKPLDEISKQRSDTPFKFQRKVRFSSTSFVCPAKLRFSEVSSSSSINSKQSDVMRRYSTTVNKHLLYTGKRRKNNSVERGCLKRIKKHELRNAKSEKEICLDQHAYAEFDKKCDEKRQITWERNNVTESLDTANQVGNTQAFLDSSNTILPECTCIEVENIHVIKAKSTAKEAEKTGNISTSRSKLQNKNIGNSNNLIKESDSLAERQFGETIGPDVYATGTTEDMLHQEIDKRNAEKAKESHVKPKRKPEKRQEPKEKVGPQSTGLDELQVLDSNNIQRSSDREVADKVNLFKKPFTAKKKTLSRQTVVEKGKKRKVISLFPPTSTPFDSPAAVKKIQPMVFGSLSPIKSPEKWNKSYSSDDSEIYEIKVKRTYSKVANFNTKSDKQNAKWESFLKKPSYHVKSSNYVSEISTSERSDSIRLFESLPNNTDESASVDPLVSESRQKKGKASERISRQVSDEVVSVDFLVPRSRLKKSKASERISRQDIDEVASVDFLVPRSRLKKGKAFYRINRQDIDEVTSVDSFVPRSRLVKSKASERKNGEGETGGSAKTVNSKIKKWFETTKLKEMAAHFNEISDTSLIIETVPKKNMPYIV